jgi:iron complex outermembrane recepter protein
MRFLITLQLLLLSVLSGYSQCRLTVKVYDYRSGLALPGASVWIKELETGKSTNNSGYFYINSLDVGEYKLRISYIGYCDTIISINVSNTNEIVKEIGLKHFSVEMPSVVVTATKNERKISDIPSRIEVIGRNKIDQFPGNSADDYLRSLTGVNVDRFSGIFSKSASITMRGLNSAQRTLILLDGIPLNKTDGGSINWNRIDVENIEKIEAIKGPVSALYGSNGMSGVINIITKNPEKLSPSDISLGYGTDNTILMRGHYNFSKITNGKGFFGGMNVFYRQGNGYILYPKQTRDSTDVKTYLQEGDVQGRIGYAFGTGSKIIAEYGYFDDKRGDGVKIYDPDGGYSKFTTNFARLSYTGSFGKYKIGINAFLQGEDFHQQKESLKIDKMPPFEITQYVLYGTFSNRNDNGIQINLSRPITKNHFITGGFDYKTGSVDASDIYYTSTDIVSNLGNMNFYALFLQDEASFLKNNLKIIAGIRGDLVKFYRGKFLIDQPTAATSLLSSTAGDFPGDKWTAICPKLSIQYGFSDKGRIYISAGRGFRPPMLDDLCRNGNISKGLKIANPYLKPEKISSIETGALWQIFNDFTLEPTIFYSLGTDFQYFVGTGDSIFAGTKMKPVLKRQNIGEAEIYGAELAFKWNLKRNLLFEGNGSYYHSVIKKFNVAGYVVTDLTGKTLMEVAPYQLNASLWWKSRYFNFALSYHYKAPQWIDDENTIKAGFYSLFDVKLNRAIGEYIKLSLSVENLFNETLIDEKGVLGIGRFLMFEVNYKFNNLKKTTKLML